MITGGIWQTVYAMAAARDNTKMGSNHLSPHAHAVLHKFTMEEAAEAVSAAWGYAAFVVAI